MVKCSKNELNTTAINTEKDDNNQYIDLNKEQCFPSYYEIIANQNKKLIKSRSLTDTPSEL